MTARVFISYRASDGADKTTAWPGTSTPGGACARARLARDPARLSDDLRALGVVPRTTPAPLGSAPLPLAALDEVQAAAAPGSASVASSPSSAAPSSCSAALSQLVLAGEEAASLAGRWRANIAKKGATTARDGEIVNVTIEQKGESLRVASSAVDIGQDLDWQKYRGFWQEHFGQR